jgi:TetR/AcrR family transcriptional repressor of uid operon
MTLAELAPARRMPEEERRAHILAAAERAFVRYGFHAAAMTQVADEAGMSAGNLYR